MKKLLLLLTIIFLGNQFSNAQIAFQGFEAGVEDTWGYTASPTFYNINGGLDFWEIRTSTDQIAMYNGNFVGGEDLRNANNGTGYTTLTFDPVAIVGGVTITFRINYQGYDTGDSIAFVVVYDNGSDWSSPDHTNLINPFGVAGSTIGWDEITHVVPSGSSHVRARVILYQNGSDEIGLDHFAINSTALPIELTSFNVEAKEDFNLLSWQTATELNNDYFTCERSKDGTNWEEFMTVDGAGNSSSVLNYVSTDEAPYSGISYYRLKQTDFDGQFEYSDIIYVDNDVLRVGQIKVHPNPITNQITIEGPEAELKDIRIYNIIGQDVTRLTSIIENKGKVIMIGLSNLNSGNYYISTKTTTQKVYKK